jgi:hypothetical protein
MANFKLVEDPKLNVPVAVPLGRAGDTIDTIYRNSRTGPSTATNPDANVTIDPTTNSGPPSVIDVVKDYDWVASPKNDIVEHPYIYLQEFRIDKSPLLAQLSYYSKVAVESTAGAVQSVTERFGESNPILGVLNKLGDAINEGKQEIIDFITAKEIQFGAVAEELSGVLSPYTGLYYTKKTDFEYKFPYFTDSMIERSANWARDFPGDTSITNLIKSGENFVAEYGSGVPVLGSYAEPGIFIERSKYFAPRPGDDSIQFNFPLLNTLNPDSIQKNFNLIWLLCFQNSSIRRDKVSAYPPCIYRALIPGVRYMLHCNIDSISIEYLGTRRRIPIIHPASNSEVEVIIPEAYNISFSINNLTAESGNLMLKSLTNV